MSENVPRRARRNLSLDEIVAVAIDMLTDADDTALTMRRLATECGVTPMALYNHVADKEEILTHVVDRVLEPVAVFDAAAHADPRVALIECGSLFRRRLLSHRGAASTFLRRPVVSPNLTRVTERLFELVDALELGSARVAETVDAVVLLTIGSIANDLTRPPEIRRLLGANEAHTEAPVMAKHLDDYANRDGDARYRQTLAWILDGVGAR